MHIGRRDTHPGSIKQGIYLPGSIKQGRVSGPKQGEREGVLACFMLKRRGFSLFYAQKEGYSCLGELKGEVLACF